MGTVTILLGTDRYPITKIGRMAGVCWGADTLDDEKNYKRGWDCITSGHGRTLEFVDVEMILDGYSARVIREWYTHIGGMPTRLQASTRYIDYGNFEYVTPPSIAADPEANAFYSAFMKYLGEALHVLEEFGIPREDVAMLLPLGMTTRIVDKRNLRNLVDMSRQRMCNRAYWEFRVMFHDIMFALKNYSDEWEQVINRLFMPKCDAMGYCEEKHGCGRHPGKVVR